MQTPLFCRGAAELARPQPACGYPNLGSPLECPEIDRQGCTSSIDFDGERLFCVGVAAPLDVARRYIRIVRLWVVSHLRSANAQAAYDLAINESEQRFRDVAETAGDWVYEMDANLRFTYISGRFFEIFPVEPAQVIGKTRQEFAGRELDEPHWKQHYSDLRARRP